MQPDCKICHKCYHYIWTAKKCGSNAGYTTHRTSGENKGISLTYTSLHHPLHVNKCMVTLNLLLLATFNNMNANEEQDHCVLIVLWSCHGPLIHSFIHPVRKECKLHRWSVDSNFVRWRYESDQSRRSSALNLQQQVHFLRRDLGEWSTLHRTSSSIQLTKSFIYH